MRSLGLPVSTVGATLRRPGPNRFGVLDPRPPVIRYERDHPRELVHIDIKKPGRIDGIGHRITGDRITGDRITGDRPGQSSKRGTGWEYVHVAIDDASRLADTEPLPGERKDSAVAFTGRAFAWFKSHGIARERVMADNGSL